MGKRVNIPVLGVTAAGDGEGYVGRATVVPV